MIVYRCRESYRGPAEFGSSVGEQNLLALGAGKEAQATLTMTDATSAGQSYEIDTKL